MPVNGVSCLVAGLIEKEFLYWQGTPLSLLLFFFSKTKMAAGNYSVSIF